jgi:hypothetical protein
VIVVDLRGFPASIVRIDNPDATSYQPTRFSVVALTSRVEVASEHPCGQSVRRLRIDLKPTSVYSEATLLPHRVSWAERIECIC